MSIDSINTAETVLNGLTKDLTDSAVSDDIENEWNKNKLSEEIQKQLIERTEAIPELKYEYKGDVLTLTLPNLESFDFEFSWPKISYKNKFMFVWEVLVMKTLKGSEKTQKKLIESFKKLEKYSNYENIDEYLESWTTDVSKKWLYNILKWDTETSSDFLYKPIHQNGKDIEDDILDKAKNVWIFIRPIYNSDDNNWHVEIVHNEIVLSSVPIVSEKKNNYNYGWIDDFHKKIILDIGLVKNIKPICEDIETYGAVMSITNIDITKIKQLKKIAWIKLSLSGWLEKIKINIPWYVDQSEVIDVVDLAKPSTKLKQILLDVKRERLSNKTWFDWLNLGQKDLIAKDAKEMVVWETALFMYNLSFQKSADWNNVAMYRQINWENVLYTTIAKENFTATIFSHIEAANEDFYKIKNKEIEDNWIIWEQQTEKLERAKKLYKTVTPFGYKKEYVKNFILWQERTDFTSLARERAWLMYLGLSYEDVAETTEEKSHLHFERDVTFTVAKYRPQIESWNTQVYFSQEFYKETKEEMIREYVWRFVDMGNVYVENKELYYDNNEFYLIGESSLGWQGAPELIDTSGFLSLVDFWADTKTMWQFTMGHWEDEDGRDYIYYYDIWDLNPFDMNITKVTGGDWFELYDRFYLDELLPKSPDDKDY